MEHWRAMKQVPITRMGWRCARCGHEWIPKWPGFAPPACPKCKSPYWNQPRQRAAVAKRRPKAE